LQIIIIKTTDCQDKYGYEEISAGAFAVRMGQGKNKNSAIRLARFSLFSANPKLLGIIRAHLGNPWLVSFQPLSAHSLF
jgi:hypothetical protein